MTAFTRRSLLIGAGVLSVSGLPEARAASATTTPRAGEDALDEALALMAAYGPEYASGSLANHGPMAADALVSLGRADAVVPWVERYRTRLVPRPSGSRRITAQNLQEALGQPDRLGDWLVFFRREVSDAPWRDVLATWIPRLSPGLVGVLFHGLIRVGHAARGLAARENALRRNELADGLAYWAAHSLPLPEKRSAAPRTRRPSLALGDVPRVGDADRVVRGSMRQRLAPVMRLAGFPAVADLAAPDGDGTAYLSDLTATFAGIVAGGAPSGAFINFLHGVTGPAAIRLILPHVPPDAQRLLLRYGWQAGAALVSAFGTGPSPTGATATVATLEQLVERAVASGEEHAIKLTEACLRENALAPDRVFGAAAKVALDRLT